MSTLLRQSLPESLKSLRTRSLFVLREQVPPLFLVGQTPNGFRRIGVVPGGSFEGERLSGEVVSGNDWQSVRTDSCIKLDVRLLLKTTDGALIAMTYTCLRAGPPDIIERLDKGESVDPGSYYFRMTPIFETAVPQYDWINRTSPSAPGTVSPTARSITSSRFSDGETNKLSKRHPPLFTERNIRATNKALNLASYDDGKVHAATIYDRI